MANGIVLNIDTTKSEFQNPMVQLRQGDGNYQSLSVTVTSNGEPFDLTGWTVTFMGTTAGGFKIVDTTSVVTDASQGEFTYTPPKAWGQDQGEFKNAYFNFVKSDETASSASFRVNVLDAVDLTAEEAKDYISVVDVMIDQVKTDMDTKLAETKQTLADTQSQANSVQENVNYLNTNVNDLKAQNNAIKTTDNTWTGTNTFNKQIIAPAGVQGNADTATKLQTSRSINGVGFDGTSDITVEPVARWINSATDVFTLDNGFYYISSLEHSPNSPVNSTSFFTVEVVQMSSNGFMRLIDHQGKSFWTTKDNGAWLEWHQDADDSTVMHLSGDETAAGFKKFSGNIATTSDNSMINGGGNNGDIAFVKRPGGSSFLAIGKENTNLHVKLSDHSSISPSDIFTDMFTAEINGVVRAGIQQDLMPLDKNVVHNTGTETVTGDKTFTGNNNFSGSTTLQNGNYGLRVTTSGVQKTSDGGATWVNI